MINYVHLGPKARTQRDGLVLRLAKGGARRWQRATPLEKAAVVGVGAAAAGIGAVAAARRLKAKRDAAQAEPDGPAAREYKRELRRTAINAVLTGAGAALGGYAGFQRGAQMNIASGVAQLIAARRSGHVGRDRPPGTAGAGHIANANKIGGALEGVGAGSMLGSSLAGAINGHLDRLDYGREEATAERRMARLRRQAVAGWQPTGDRSYAASGAGLVLKATTGGVRRWMRVGGDGIGKAVAAGNAYNRSGVGKALGGIGGTLEVAGNAAGAGAGIARALARRKGKGFQYYDVNRRQRVQGVGEEAGRSVGRIAGQLINVQTTDRVGDAVGRLAEKRFGKVGGFIAGAATRTLLAPAVTGLAGMAGAALGKRADAMALARRKAAARRKRAS